MFKIMKYFANKNLEMAFHKDKAVLVAKKKTHGVKNGSYLPWSGD